MRTVCFLLAPPSAPLAPCLHDLEQRGIALLSGPGDASPGVFPASAPETLNAELLALFGCAADFQGAIDFESLPGVIEDDLAGGLRRRLRESPPGPPLVQPLAAWRATLPFWLQAFPSTAAVYLLEGQQDEDDDALDAFLRAVLPGPAFVLALPRGSGAREAPLDRLAAWIRNLDRIPPRPPSGERRPWLARRFPEPAPQALLGWDGELAPALRSRLESVDPSPSPKDVPPAPPLRFEWNRALREAPRLTGRFDLHRLLAADMLEKEDALRLMDEELLRLKERLRRQTRLTVQWRRSTLLHHRPLAARPRRGARAGLLPQFRLFRRAALLHRLPPADPDAPSADAAAGAAREATDSQRLEGLSRLRKAAGRSAAWPHFTPEILRFAPHPTEAATWIAADRSLPARPRFSVVLTIRHDDPDRLASTLQSLADQAYGEWEVCLALDASAPPPSRESIRVFQARLPSQVRVAEPGHSPGPVAPARAAALATGEFVTFLDSEDRLALDALLKFAQRIAEAPDVDLLYADEDTFQRKGGRTDPFLKPVWSPDLLLAFNYIGRPLVIRRSLFEAVGGLREEFGESALHDLVLRASEKARRIERVRGVLYHGRASAQASARRAIPPDGPWLETSRRALRDAVARRAWDADVTDGLVPGAYHVTFAVDPSERVTIIIPSADNAAGLARCVRSVLKHTRHAAFDILIVSNNATRPEMFALLEELPSRGPVRVLRHDAPFNYPALNNLAVARCDAPFVLLLNDDIEVLHSGWMTALLEHARRPGVGAVGAQLVYPSRLVQHAGVYIHPGFLPGHTFKYLEESHPGDAGLNRIVRECSAVTAACLMIRRELYREVGGLDEAFAVAFNDVDFCFRLLAAGYRNLYTPYARLLHYESASRGSDRDPARQQRMQAELALLRDRWRARFEPDPCYNPRARDYAHPGELESS